MGGRLLDWMGAGLAASRPLAASMPALLTTSGSTAFYFQTDTSILSIFDESGPSWFDIDAAALAAIAFLTLPDVDATGLADGNVFKWSVTSSKLVPLALAFQTAESIQDLVGAMVVNGVGTTGSYDDPSGTFKFDSTITQYTDEAAMDAIAAAFAAGTHTGLTITYNDGANKFDFAVTGATYTNEDAQDAVAAAIAAGSHTGITIGYNDAGNAISFTVTVTQYTDEMARDAIGAALIAGFGVAIDLDDPGDTIKISNTGLLQAIPTTGNLYPPDTQDFNTSVNATTANSISFFPFSKRITIDAIVVEITTASAGSNMRLGLYDSDPITGLPNTLIEGSGDISTATTGVKTFTLTTPKLVTRRLWIARIHSSAVPQGRGGSSSRNNHFFGNSVVNVSAGLNCLTLAQAYGALPASPSGFTPAALGIMNAARST